MDIRTAIAILFVIVTIGLIQETKETLDEQKEYNSGSVRWTPTQVDSTNTANRLRRLTPDSTQSMYP